MTAAIVTDSNVSLPPELLDGLPVFVVPMEIHHNGQAYRDGVDITPSAFYELQRTSDTLPTTSAPQPGAFVEAYEAAARQADEIVCIALSSALSATFAAAEGARHVLRETQPTLPIEVIDSRSAGTAQGLIVLAAARQARDGANAADVAAEARRTSEEVALYGYLQSLYYVWKGGRVPRVLMWMGKLLGVKPLLQLADGKIGMVERPRTEKKAMERLGVLASKWANGSSVRVAVMHADAPDRAEELSEYLKTTLATEEMFITEFTPVIGAHTGPGLVGCAVQRLGGGG